jgi:hypothetical protein
MKEMKMKTTRWMVGKAGVVAVVLAAVGMMGADAPRARQRITFEELNSQYQLIGDLGKPMGTYMTLEGIYREGMPFWMEVDTLDGKKLEKPMRVVIKDLDVKFKDKRVVVRGFESCGIEGRPMDPEKKHQDIPQQAFGLHNWFVVTEKK